MEDCSTDKEPSIKVLMEKVKPIVKEKRGFEGRDISFLLIMAFSEHHDSNPKFKIHHFSIGKSSFSTEVLPKCLKEDVKPGVVEFEKLNVI